jgi:hypothetical protein
VIDLTIHHDDSTDVENVLARLREERDSGLKSAAGMHSVGGWHTKHFRFSENWLGEAMAQRLARAGQPSVGSSCWGNILPAGAEYSAHVHHGYERVAVWCLTDSGGGLFVADESGDVTIIADSPGRLTIFDGSCRHWVPKVECERVTVAANLASMRKRNAR